MTRRARIPPAAPDSSHLRIAQAVRREIARGKYPPGTRLPSHQALRQRFHASPVTVQQALDALGDEGFIRTAERQGIFVADRLPFVGQYAVAFPWAARHDVSQFFRALRWEAERWQTPQRRIAFYHEIGRHADVADHQRLSEQVRTHRVAGVIFAGNPFELGDSPILTEPHVPRVAVMMPANAGQVAFPTVYPDLAGFLPRALAHLAATGRRRVALAALASSSADLKPMVSRWQRFVAAHGLTTRRSWMQFATATLSAGIEHAVAAVFQPGTPKRPDALVVADDNLVPAATAGLVKAAGRGAAAVEVVAFTNFPHPTASAVPVTRLGYDSARLMALCLEYLDQQRRHEVPPAHTALPPLWEQEWMKAKTT